MSTIAVGANVAVQSFVSTTCPACGLVKKSRHSLCGRCYFKLRVEQRDALYDPVGQGYVSALERALRSLYVTTPHWPTRGGAA